MRILILTQTVNRQDSVLGFFHRWIEEFAKNAEQVSVVALGVGEYSFPENVVVKSLGKESGVGKLRRIFNFYAYAWTLRKEYDVVFVHMNPEYVVLGGLLWRLLGKKIVLWYTHKSVTVSLRVATFLAHSITTASKESFRIPSKKIVVTGHGIDTTLFSFNPHDFSTPLHLVAVGRISPAKDQLLLLKAMALCKEKKIPVHLFIVGLPLTPRDYTYQKALEVYVEKNALHSVVSFVGSKSQNKLADFLPGMDILLHASTTGSLDKVVLEALAVGVVPITSNNACGEVLGEYQSLLSFMEGNALSLVEALERVRGVSNIRELQTALHMSVVRKHELSTLIPRILKSI
ncbi:MAG: glycosyltransferase family 4 protein [Candidatus Paceibacterota bacterium]